MSHSTRRGSTLHHRESSTPYAMEYLAVDQSSPDFPVSGLWSCELEPDTHPIRHLHSHKSLEVGQCHSGTGILMVEDRVMSFSAGDVAIVCHDQMHMSRAANENPARWTYFWFDPSMLLACLPEGLEIADQSMLSGPGFSNIVSASSYPQVSQIVSLMIDQIRTPSAGSRAAIRGLAAALMALVHRTCKEQPKATNAAARTGIERVSPALRYLANHYAEEIDVEELAELCFLSLTHFRRVFMAAVGTPPLQYLATIRVRMAAGRLQDELETPVTSIASAVGFDSINTFNRQFRQTIGMSPRQWRKSRQAN